MDFLSSNVIFVDMVGQVNSIIAKVTDVSTNPRAASIPNHHKYLEDQKFAEYFK